MANPDNTSGQTTEHIAAIVIDEAGLTARTSELEHERKVAMNDLIAWNHFAVTGAQGPYRLELKNAGGSILLLATGAGAAKPVSLPLPLAPLRSVIRDYFLICESYFEAVKTGNIARIEAIDMSRRALHNEGSDILTELLEGKVEMDSETSRRLFTLVCVLHLR